MQMLQLLRGMLGRQRGRGASISLTWYRRHADAWLTRELPATLAAADRGARTAQIERLAALANALGPQPLWSGYPPQGRGPTRQADDVRTARAMGELFTRLVERRRPEVVVEFGAAFGVSGMYWLAGIEANGFGELLSFEPNEGWARIARENLARIGTRFRLTVGTFEECVDAVLGAGRRLDLAFIDAIHTPEFVMPQLELVVARSRPGVLVVLDEVNFSEAMGECWEQIARDPRFVASARLGRRVGILELAREPG
jgi:predicted O-methyltransferase YrrM